MTLEMGEESVIWPNYGLKYNPNIGDNEIEIRSTLWLSRTEVIVNSAQDIDGFDDEVTIHLQDLSGKNRPSVVHVKIIDDDIEAEILVSPSDGLTLDEGGSGVFDVRLSSTGRPTFNMTVSASTNDPFLTISPASLTFTNLNLSTPQRINVHAPRDSDTADNVGNITFSASGGGIGAMDVTRWVRVTDLDEVEFEASPMSVTVMEGRQAFFEVRLASQPSAKVRAKLSASNPLITLDADPDTPGNQESLIFERAGKADAWDRSRTVMVYAAHDEDKDDESFEVVLRGSGGNYQAKTLTVKGTLIDDDKGGSISQLPIKTRALAIPPSDAQDNATVRIRCRQNAPCHVVFDCSAQNDGSNFVGALPAPIPAWGALSVTTKNIEEYTGASWSGKGRLNCALRSLANISSQVWTLSGNGVLVNNSAMIRSVRQGELYRADIESIPSPYSVDGSNIRIHCESRTRDCLDTKFICYSDDGTGYEWILGTIPRLTTRHLQTKELSDGLNFRWRDLSLSCEVYSIDRFSAQVLTRTGGGDALVNNSATGG
ncbi:MAG: hypothetical protein ISN28_08880 [Ectothiorhodospiraceae bacterium AqS1]|nr:hypothetical protein [Ectothiorhodospiraceae bacterium AqS1]